MADARTFKVDAQFNVNQSIGSWNYERKYNSKNMYNFLW
jgi:hypothetical protein